MELYCLDLGKKLLFAWVGAWSLSNKSFSSITACLEYWVIVTNTVVVFHNRLVTITSYIKQAVIGERFLFIEPPRGIHHKL